MLARFASRGRPTFSAMNRLSLQRQFANAKKKSKSSKPLWIIGGVAILAPIGYGIHLYSADKRSRDYMNEKILCYTPYIRRCLTKWFPMDEQSPYRVFVRFGKSLEG